MRNREKVDEDQAKMDSVGNLIHPPEPLRGAKMDLKKYSMYKFIMSSVLF